MIHLFIGNYVNSWGSDSQQAEDHGQPTNHLIIQTLALIVFASLGAAWFVHRTMHRHRTAVVEAAPAESVREIPVLEIIRIPPVPVNDESIMPEEDQVRDMAMPAWPTDAMCATKKFFHYKREEAWNRAKNNAQAGADPKTIVESAESQLLAELKSMDEQAIQAAITAHWNQGITNDTNHHFNAVWKEILWTELPEMMGMPFLAKAGESEDESLDRRIEQYSEEKMAEIEQSVKAAAPKSWSATDIQAAVLCAIDQFNEEFDLKICETINNARMQRLAILEEKNESLLRCRHNGHISALQKKTNLRIQQSQIAGRVAGRKPGRLALLLAQSYALLRVFPA